MATISQIKQQQRRKDRYSIYLEDKYAFSLSEEQLMNAGLASGQTLTAADQAKLIELSDLGKAIDRIYNLLSFRPRSNKEVKDYLRRKDYDDDTAQAVVEYFESKRLLDDAAFAQAWAEDRQRFSHRSQRQLRSKLMAKGIDSESIATALAKLPDDSDRQSLTELIRSRNLLSRYPDKQKLTAHLVGKGFSYSSVKALLGDIASGEIEL